MPLDAPSSLVARVASAAQGAAVCRWVNDCWRGALTERQSEERWHRFHATAFARGSHIVVLVPHDADATAMPLAAVELFWLRALYAEAGSDEVAEVDALTAAGALVPEQHRGRSHMLTLCRRYFPDVAARSPTPARVLLGFSEDALGAAVWRRGDGRPYAGWSCSWSQDRLAHLELPRICQYLRPVDVEYIARLDRTRLERRLRARPRHRARFCVLPTAALYEATMRRNFDTIAAVRGRHAVPWHIGVLLDDENYALWLHSYTTDAVVVIRLEATSQASLALLLAVAGAAAHWCQLARVVAWDVEPALLPGAEGALRWAHARPERRETAVPFARLPDDSAGELDWVAIEASNSLFIY